VSSPEEIDLSCRGGLKTVYPSRKHKLKLVPGRYIVRVKAFWTNANVNREYRITTLSERKIELTQMEKIPFFLPRNYLLNPEIDRKRKKKKDRQFIYDFNGYNTYIYAENNTDKNWLIDIEFSELDNFKIAKPWKYSENKIKIKIPPG
jgi:hypothetical protein